MEGWMEACAKLKACTHETINDLITKWVLYCYLKSFLIKPAFPFS
jgi:hypothetical protein